jgi:hypothetical protein
MCHLHCQQMFLLEQLCKLKSGALAVALMKVVRPAVEVVAIHELPLKFNLLVNHSQSSQARAEAVETT